jgi:uncharacterized protein
VMFGRQPIQGSCGGVGRFGLSGECEFCGGDPAKCEEEPDTMPNAAAKTWQDLAYDATSGGATRGRRES